MLNEIATKRIQKEIMDLDRDPPPGITCYPKDDTITDLEAYIKGPPDSPYETGIFKLSIQIPDRYPFQPPQIKFITSIYHPNIDDTGRICADILKMGEKGEWKPAINLSTALTSLRQLLAAPNPDDPLDADIAREYQLDHPTFLRNAQEYTLKYASEDIVLNSEIKSDSTDTIKNEEIKKMEEEEEEEEEEPVKKTKTSLSLSKRKVNGLAVMDDTLHKKVSEMKVDITENTKELKVMGEPSYRYNTEELKRIKDQTDIDTKNKVSKSNLKSKSEDQNVNVTQSTTICKENPIHLDTAISLDTIKSKDSLLKKRRKEKSLINISSKKLKTLVNHHSHPQKESMHYPIEQNGLNERKPLASTSFKQNIIILSDDDDDTNGKPVLHTLQLSKKTNRNKLSLSKKRHS